jgi:hypothetical protein
MNGAGASSGSGFPNNFSPSDKNFSNKPSTSNSSSSYLSDKPETEASGMGTNAIANLEKMASLKFEATGMCYRLCLWRKPHHGTYSILIYFMRVTIALIL